MRVTSPGWQLQLEENQVTIFLDSSRREKILQRFTNDETHVKIVIKRIEMLMNVQIEEREE